MADGHRRVQGRRRASRPRRVHRPASRRSPATPPRPSPGPHPSTAAARSRRYTITPYIGTTAQTRRPSSPGSPPTEHAGQRPHQRHRVHLHRHRDQRHRHQTRLRTVHCGHPGEQPAGQWSALMTWPFVAVHSVALNNGNLLWDGWHQPEPTYLWDPLDAHVHHHQRAGQHLLLRQRPAARRPGHDVGGYGVVSTGQLGINDTASSIRPRPRGAPPRTCTAPLVPEPHRTLRRPLRHHQRQLHRPQPLGGHPEVYDPATNTWTAARRCLTPQVHEQEYPFSYLAPNGKVFTIGPSEDVSYWLDVNNQTWIPVGASGVVNGSARCTGPARSSTAAVGHRRVRTPAQSARR